MKSWQAIEAINSGKIVYLEIDKERLYFFLNPFDGALFSSKNLTNEDITSLEWDDFLLYCSFDEEWGII